MGPAAGRRTTFHARQAPPASVRIFAPLSSPQDDRAGPAAPAHYTAPARLQPFPDASSSLLDRDGKAIYASPGPGTYDFPTQFTPVRTKYERKGAVLATLSPLSLTHGLDKYEAKVINNSGNHVFSKAPAYSFGLR